MGVSNTSFALSLFFIAVTVCSTLLVATFHIVPSIFSGVLVVLFLYDPDRRTQRAGDRFGNVEVEAILSTSTSEDKPNFTVSSTNASQVTGPLFSTSIVTKLHLILAKKPVATAISYVEPKEGHCVDVSDFFKPRLPIEIQEMVMGFLSTMTLFPVHGKDISPLTTCGIVCKLWYNYTRPLLFRSVTINSPKRLHSSRNLARDLRIATKIFHYTQDVYIEERTKQHSTFAHLAVIYLPLIFPNCTTVSIAQIPDKPSDTIIQWPFHSLLLVQSRQCHNLQKLKLTRYSMSFTDLRRLVSAFPILHTLSLYDMDVKLGANELNAIYTACVSPRLTFVKIDGLINHSMDCYAYLWLSTRPRPSQKPSKTSSHPTSSIRLSHLDARLFTKLVELQSESAGTLTKLRWRKLFAWIKEEEIWVLKHLQFSRCICAFIFSTRDLRSAHHYHHEETPKLQVIVLVHRIEDVYDRYDWRKMDNLFSSFGHHLGIHIEIIIEDNNSNEKTDTKTIAERVDIIKSKIPWIWDHLHPNVWIGDRIYNIDYKSFDPQKSIIPSLPKTIQDSIFI